MKNVKHFKSDLAFSQDPQIISMLDKTYYQSFPELIGITRIDTIEMQKKGVDLILHFPEGRDVLCDEKIRDTKYPKDDPDSYDIFLETLQDVEQGAEGWFLDDRKITEKILYIILDSSVLEQCTMLVWDQYKLKESYLNKKDQWAEVKKHRSQNAMYQSEGLCPTLFWLRLRTGVPIEQFPLHSDYKDIDYVELAKKYGDKGEA